MSDTATTPATSGAATGSTGPASPTAGDNSAATGSTDHGTEVRTSTAAAYRQRYRKSWQAKRWQNNLWDTTPSSVLVEEAGRLTERRDRRRATRLLAVAAATTEDREQRNAIFQQLAVTAADGGRHRVSSETVFELQQVSPRDADLWVAFANVALSRGNYVHADSAARSALELDEDHQGAWAVLAASYAGLGWFEAADTCLDHTDRNSLTSLERWRIGRAVNRWALDDTRWVVLAAISALLLGVLALAIAVSIPFAAREWRLYQIRQSETGKTFATMAAEAWKYERRLRLWHIGVVSASVLAFVLATIF